MQKILLISVLFLFNHFLIGQNFQEVSNVTFEVNGQALKNGMAGGLNAPQFSSADLNNDGLDDVVIFDRIGNVWIPLINEGGPCPDCYAYAPEYKANFPVVNNWVMLRDYNMDGIQDLFSYSTTPGIPGISVHKGSIENDQLQFDLVTFSDYEFDILSYPGSNDLPINLFVSNIDYPAIDDIDCDGDLDVLTFNSGGGFVELYQNLAVENGWSLDSLVFILAEDCWGGFYESGLSVELSLPQFAGDCANLTGNEVVTRHAGSTLLTLDANADEDKEVILGDLAFTNLTMMVNNGSCDQAFCNEQIINYPEDTPADIPIFPASFYLDIDNDGVKDLVASPNNINNSLDIDNVLYWKNNGSNNNVDFEFNSNTLFAGDMVDLGTGTAPTFADVNADGLLDLVVGTVTTFLPYGEKDGRLYLYLNIGSATNPIFELEDDNWLNFQQYNSDAFSFSPTFGDLDGDGDLDILVGEEFGFLFHGENIAGPGQPMEFGSIRPEYKNIDVGQISTPLIYDLDKDGLVDLIIGERNGNINFFKNTGTASDPSFNPDPNVAPNTAFLGSVDTREQGFVTGQTAPVIIETLSETFLITGSQIGKVYRYDNILDEIYGEFTLNSENLLNETIGSRTKPAFADLNADGLLDVIIGNTRGGLSAFTTEYATEVVSVSQPGFKSELQIFPNPSNDYITLSHTSNEVFRAEIFDIQGRYISDVKSGPVNVNHLNSGVYLIKAYINGSIETKKFIKY